MTTAAAVPTLEWVRERMAQILEIAARYGASDVRVFGSVARGEGRPESDVDFLIHLEMGRSLLDLGGLYHELTDLLGRPVDVVLDDSLKERARPGILATAVPL